MGAAATVLAVLLALTSYALFGYAFHRDIGSDVAAYWNAAERLRVGEPLYVAAAANASDLYRYAPWFAAAWMPLTLLPHGTIVVAWVSLMIVAAAISTVPLLLRGPAGLAAFAIFAPLQLEAALYGNVQPLLVLVLLWGAERRSGPLWIALGASLKAAPLLLAAVYAGRGEWRRAGLSAALTALLVAPMLLFDRSAYSFEPGPNQMSLAGVSPILWAAIALLALGTTWLLARTRYAWLAAAVAMIMALPRLLPYETGFTLIGLSRSPSGDSIPR